MLSIQSLRVDYDQVVAVKDFSLELKAGEIYGLVGPNGAGKTSLMKAIAGILEPTYGDVSIAGYNTQLDRDQALKHLGYMPDFSPLYENLKVWEYMDVFGAAYLMSQQDRQQKLKYWLERLDLMGKYDEFIRNLSRGMQQRLVLAKTLLSDPKVLVLDEPASGLDPIARVGMRNVLEEVSALGKTIIISSHVLSELSEFCTSIGIMEKGKLVVSGSMDEIRSKTGSQTKILIKLFKSEQSPDLIQTLTNFNLTTHPSPEDPSVLAVYFNGDEARAAELLKQLTSQGFLMSEFKIQKENIEDIFLKVGAKEAS